MNIYGEEASELPPVRHIARSGARMIYIEISYECSFPSVSRQWTLQYRDSSDKVQKVYSYMDPGVELGYGESKAYMADKFTAQLREIGVLDADEAVRIVGKGNHPFVARLE